MSKTHMKTLSVTVNAFLKNLRKNFKVKKTNCGGGQYAVDIYEKKRAGAYIGTIAYITPKEDDVDLRRDEIACLDQVHSELVYMAYEEAA